MGFLMAQVLKNPHAMWETWVRFLVCKVSLEKGMATHSSILVWRIPWTEELGRLQSMGSQSQTQLSDFHFTSRRACEASCPHLQSIEARGRHQQECPAGLPGSEWNLADLLQQNCKKGRKAGSQFRRPCMEIHRGRSLTWSWEAKPAAILELRSRPVAAFISFLTLGVKV